MVIDSKEILDQLNLKYETKEDSFCEPSVSNLTFGELFPQFNASTSEEVKALAKKKLYEHQYKTFEYLEKGFNIILKSGTGSGKTEAWATYALKYKKKVLVIYPTLALSSDQILRLEKYYSCLEKGKVVKVEKSTVSEARKHKKNIRSEIDSANLVVTNPAFLMIDIKRYAVKTNPSYLSNFLSKTDLIVVDELDYYGSSKATLLIGLLELIVKYMSTKKPQICILTATLGNPEELGRKLSEINGRETKIIEGKAFKVKNKTYIILGHKEKKEDVSDSDYVIELISRYVKDDGVTIVFTSSIRKAEEIVRKVKNKLKPLGLESAIEAHHHLKDQKEMNEN